MKKFSIVYEENKKLDELFNNDHDIFSPEILKKNIIELLVEIGELANETRCFKYWSIKKPSSKEVILDEYADGMIMILFFHNYLKMDLDYDYKNLTEEDVNNQFLTVYKLAANLHENINANYVQDLFNNFIHLGYLINFNDDDIINGTLIKIEKNKKRMKENFIN